LRYTELHPKGGAFCHENRNVNGAFAECHFAGVREEFEGNIGRLGALDGKVDRISRCKLRGYGLIACIRASFEIPTVRERDLIVA
jgi:hypothetical protein